MENLIGPALARLGVGRVDVPARGDIALVGAPGGETGAIVLDTGWIALNWIGRGVVLWTTTLAPVRMAWRL